MLLNNKRLFLLFIFQVLFYARHTTTAFKIPCEMVFFAEWKAVTFLCGFLMSLE